MFENLCIFVLWTKVASALEGLKAIQTAFSCGSQEPVLGCILRDPPATCCCEVGDEGSICGSG